MESPLVKMRERLRSLFQPQLSGTIDDFVALADQAAVWEPEVERAAVQQHKKRIVREVLKDLRDSEGWPIFESLASQNPEGHEVRVYKQEVLFTPTDYRQLVKFYVEREEYDRGRATILRDRAHQRYDLQLRLPWEGKG